MRHFWSSLNVGTQCLVIIGLVFFALSLSMDHTLDGHAYGLHNSWPFWTLAWSAAIALEAFIRGTR